MKINEKHSAIILERVFDCQDKYELIDLVSERDKERTPIHRVILMAASKYFADLFRTTDSSEKPEECIIGSNGEVIKSVVDFCYSGHIDLTEQNVEKCLKIAVKMEIDLLLNECRDYYAAKLSSETVVEVLLIADKYNLDDLQQRASELLCSDLEKVPATQILRLNPALMLNLMENVGEAISCDLLVKRLLSWFQHDEAKRGKHMPKLLRLIRLEQLSEEILSGTIEPLFKQFECADLLYNEFKRRAMYLSPIADCPSNEVDKWTVFSVNISQNEKNANCSTRTFIVERYDDSLDQFTPHFTSPPIDDEYVRIIILNDKIFAPASKRPMIAYESKTGGEEELLPMNKDRYGYTTIVMDKSLYVFGGRRGTKYLSSCERYDTEKGTWQTIKSMNHNRKSASAAILNGLIYVVGGLEREGGLYNRSTRIESYDPKTNEWTERTALDVGICQAPLVAFNGMLYAFVDHGCREYDPVKNIWTEMQNDYSFESVVSANSTLFAITKTRRFGKVTINKRKIDFVEHTKVGMSRDGYLSLQQYRFEE